jgi:hypothetical protein
MLNHFELFGSEWGKRSASLGNAAAARAQNSFAATAFLPVRCRLLT